MALTSAAQRCLKRRGTLRVQLYSLRSRHSLCHPRDSVRSRCRARALSADPTSQSLDGEHHQSRGECARGTRPQHARLPHHDFALVCPQGHGCPRAEPLPVDAGSVRVRIAVDWGRLREGVRALRGPSAAAAACVLSSGNFCRYARSPNRYARTPNLKF